MFLCVLLCKYTSVLSFCSQIMHSCADVFRLSRWSSLYCYKASFACLFHLQYNWRAYMHVGMCMLPHIEVGVGILSQTFPSYIFNVQAVETWPPNNILLLVRHNSMNWVPLNMASYPMSTSSSAELWFDEECQYHSHGMQLACSEQVIPILLHFVSWSTSTE